MKLYVDIKPNEDDEMYRYDHRPKQCIVVDQQNRLVFFHKFQYPYLNGSVYFGKITGVDNILKAVFVQFGEENYQGILSFYSIDLSILGPIGEKLKQKVIAENPDHLRNSKIYQNIPFDKYLHIDQIVLVQAINVYMGKGITLSTFINLISGDIKYMPNSLYPKVVCNNKYISKYIMMTNLPGSVLVYNRYKNHSIHDLKTLENLVYKWQQIQAIRKTFSYNVNLLYNPLPIDYIISQFPITEICITSHKLKNSIEYTYNRPTTLVNKAQLNQYQCDINNITHSKINLTPVVQCEFFSSSTASQITLSASKRQDNKLLIQTFRKLIKQIKLRNLGGLILIIAPPMFQAIACYIREQLYQSFYNDKIVSYIYKMKRNTICVISKKYTYRLMQSYLSRIEDNRQEQIIYIQGIKLLIIFHNKILHVDVNRSKSRLDNYQINIMSIKALITHYNNHYSNNYCDYIVIDLLELLPEQRLHLAQYITSTTKYIYQICPLSVLILQTRP